VVLTWREASAYVLIQSPVLLRRRTCARHVRPAADPGSLHAAPDCRSGSGSVATFGLLLSSWACAQRRCAMDGGGLDRRAYWFTSSTSFANPPSHRPSLSNTFAGIALRTCRASSWAAHRRARCDPRGSPAASASIRRKLCGVNEVNSGSAPQRHDSCSTHYISPRSANDRQRGRLQALDSGASWLRGRAQAAARALQQVTLDTVKGAHTIKSAAELARLIDVLYTACFVVIAYLVGPSK